MTGQMALAQINRIANGYTIRFAEACEQERPAAPALPPGQLEVQAEIMLAFADMRESDEVDTAGGWADHVQESRRERVDARLKELREKLATQTVRGWVLEMREAFVPDLKQMMAVLEHAAHEHAKIMTLVSKGTTFFGPLQPSLLSVPG